MSQVLLLQSLLIMILISVVIIRYRWFAGGEYKVSSFQNCSMCHLFHKIEKCYRALTKSLFN